MAYLFQLRHCNYLSHIIVYHYTLWVLIIQVFFLD